MTGSATKNLHSPDETKTFDRGRCDVVRVGPMTVGRVILEPGWRWSESHGGASGSQRCEIAHNGYIVSGRLHFAMSDGDEMEVGPGDVFVAPPGHDVWVAGSERCEVLDFATNLATYEIPFALHPATEPERSGKFAHATANPPLMPSKEP
jgi:Cupin domain